jgi:hypothetical protein
LIRPPQVKKLAAQAFSPAATRVGFSDIEPPRLTIAENPIKNNSEKIRVLNIIP